MHHIHAERTHDLLAKYRVRKAREPRNFRFTFAEDGFYRTLRRKVAKQIQHVDRKPELMSKVIFRSHSTLI